MVERGDKFIGQLNEAPKNSELNFLSIQEVRSPEVAVQKEISDRICRMQDSILSTVEKLAAYHPNGLQGVLESMVPGPAYDQLAALLNPGNSTVA